MATLDHPNCVRVLDFFEEEGRAVLVSEYVRGASLRQVADHEGHLTPEQSLGVLKGALSGLAYAHGRGLVHRDIKPDNLLADLEGVSKLADFGQALVASGPGAAGGMPVGSPAYMSPEMVTGGRVDLRTDIYSLGAVLFEFLTGRAPYTGDSPLAVMRKHTNDPVPDPRALNSELPEGVGALVTRAMAKDPETRQRTAEQFLDELEAAAVAGYGEDWEKRSSIKRLVAATAAALGLLLVGAGGAAAATATTGQAVVGGGNRWLIAGGIAAVLLLAVAILGLTRGRHSGSSGGAAVLATPTPTALPSASEQPSPSPIPTPSESPSISPSPSPTRVPTPLPTPSQTPRTNYLAITNLAVWYSPCRTVSLQYCGNPATYGPGGNSTRNAYNNPDPYLRLADAFDYAFSGTAPGPVVVTVTWTAVNDATGAAYPPAQFQRTLNPPSESHPQDFGTSYLVQNPNPSSNDGYFTVSYTDTAGNHSTPSAHLYWVFP